MAQPKHDDAEFALAVLDATLSDLESDVRELKRAVRDLYIKRVEFDPVKGVVFGLIAIVLLGAVAALVAVVLVFR